VASFPSRRHNHREPGKDQVIATDGAKTHPTLRAARAFTRRGLLRCGLAAAAGTALAGCQTTAGRTTAERRLRVALWSPRYLPQGFRDALAERDGIALEVVEYNSNTELLARLKVEGAEAFDLVGPTVDRAPLWRSQNLLQPVDTTRFDTTRVLSPLLAESRRHWTWDGALYHLPMMWGTEALAWRSDKWSREPGQLSYGDLWLPEMKDRVQARPYSMMVGIGLYLERSGTLRSNRMLDAYNDPAACDRIWTEVVDFAIERRFWIRQFWYDGFTQREGFTSGDCLIGQTWDSAAASLQLAGKPVTYMAPREGALAWIDGLAISAGARDLDAVYTFLEFLYRAKTGGRIASSAGFNAAQAGAAEFMVEEDRRIYEKSLPGDALQHLWFWPPAPDWYRQQVNGHIDRYMKAADREPAPA
jgi:spermidine/putrescine transport system substrate-binding protein